MSDDRAIVESLLATAEVFALPMVHRFRSITVREGMLLRGPAGWAEFAPFAEYDDQQCVPWLRAAVEQATRLWPTPLRQRVPVNAIVPLLTPAAAAERVSNSGATTVKVKVGGLGTSLREDLARVAAVREALGPSGAIRVDANAAWSVEEAVDAIAHLDRAAAGLEYVEQPCPEVPQLREVRSRVRPPIAADESIRLTGDPLAVARAGAADIAVIKVAPLGGISAALKVAEDTGLAVVISSAVDSAVGLAAGIAAAAALSDLPYACGLGTSTLLVGDVVVDPPRVVDGWLPVPSGPPSPSPGREWAAAPEVRDRWLSRVARVAALL